MVIGTNQASKAVFGTVCDEKFLSVTAVHSGDGFSLSPIIRGTLKEEKDWIHTTLVRSARDKLASGSTGSSLPRELGSSLCESFSISTMIWLEGAHNRDNIDMEEILDG
jgi:hypothetical protein